MCSCHPLIKTDIRDRSLRNSTEPRNVKTVVKNYTANVVHNKLLLHLCLQKINDMPCK